VSKPRPLAERLDEAKCPESPTGAHHWLLPHIRGRQVMAIGTCKYCGQEREFQVGWREEGQMDVAIRPTSLGVFS
jgi:hypothetical protein